MSNKKNITNISSKITESSPPPTPQIIKRESVKNICLQNTSMIYLKVEQHQWNIPKNLWKIYGYKCI